MPEGYGQLTKGPGNFPEEILGVMKYVRVRNQIILFYCRLIHDIGNLGRQQKDEYIITKKIPCMSYLVSQLVIVMNDLQ